MSDDTKLPMTDQQAHRYSAVLLRTAADLLDRSGYPFAAQNVRDAMQVIQTHRAEIDRRLKALESEGAKLALLGQKLKAENARLLADNLNFQDRLTEYVGPVTDEERLELIRLRVSHTSLVHAFEQVCQQIEGLTGRDPRLPERV